MEAETIHGQQSINNKWVIPVLSPAAAVLIVFSGLTSILTPGFYYRETLNWQAQSLGQDYINVILIAPFLVISSILSYKSSRFISLWAGTLVYLVYTYVIYCFDVKFNSLFIIYCIILGLCFYSLMYFIYISFNQKSEPKSPHKTTALYLIIIAAVFYALWLSELLPSIINGVSPGSLLDAGLPTNPVHAIDLSIALPGIFLSGWFLLRKNPVGFITAPIVLVFCILMDITIGFLTIYMKIKEIDSGITITIIMGILAVVSTILLLPFLKQNLHIK